MNMNKKIIIIPDVHGRIFWREILKIENPEDYIFIFLGDYLDPYPDENIGSATAFLEFLQILEFKKKYPNNVILLIGNHDFHYINLYADRCSRFDRKNMSLYNSIFNKNKDLFQLTYATEDCLFSHAGLINKWLTTYNLEVYKTPIEVSNYLNKLYNEGDENSDIKRGLQLVSFYRGGFFNGSIIWRDVRESINEDFYQVFGHTQLTKPYITDKFACLDCRKIFILEDKSIKEWCYEKQTSEN